MAKAPLFHAGQPVVCVKEEWVEPVGFSPKLGKIYVVQDVYLFADDNEWSISLCEDPEKVSPWYFWESHFAPVELLPDAALEELLSEALEGALAL